MTVQTIQMPSLAELFGYMSDDGIAELISNMADTIQAKDNELVEMERIRQTLMAEKLDAQRSLEASKHNERALSRTVGSLRDQIAGQQDQVQEYKARFDALNDKVVAMIVGDWRTLPGLLGGDEWEKLDKLIRNRSTKIEAIRMLRRHVGISLKEAKDLVEHIYEIYTEIPF